MRVFFANSYSILESEDGVTIAFGFTLPGEKPAIQAIVMSQSGFKTLTLECIEELKKLEEHGKITEWKRPETEPSSVIIT